MDRQGLVQRRTKRNVALALHNYLWQAESLFSMSGRVWGKYVPSVWGVFAKAAACSAWLLCIFWEMVDDCLVASDWEVSLQLFSSCASHSGCWSPLLDGYFNFGSTFILLLRVVQDCVCVVQDLTPCRGVIIFAVLVSFVFLTVLRVFVSAR